MANFTKDTTSIKQSVSFSAITATGGYTGYFSKAYKRKSQSSNAEAIHFDFVSSGGSSSFDIWHTNKNGEPISIGNNSIQELMVLLDIDNLREKKNDTIEKYDFDIKAVVDVRVDSYPQIVEKQIGCVFQMEEYIKQENVDGKWADTNPPIIKERPVFLRFFEANTGKSAYEKLNNIDQSDDIESMLFKLPKVKKVKVSDTVREDSRIMEKAPAPNNAEPFDDSDIPF